MFTSYRSRHVLASPSAPRRPRRVRGVLAALALAVGLSTTAAAIPPGGPVENRGGASITITNKVVHAIGTPDAVNPGMVNFTGTGFNNGEVLNIKVDDGLVLPTTPVAGTDVFAQVTADPSGNVTGSINLADAAPAHAAELTEGKHNLRFLASGRSIHADFAVTGQPLPVGTVNPAARAFIGPPADMPVDESYIPGGHLYDDIPKLSAGSVVPYRLTGFSPNQTVNIRVDDGRVTQGPGASGVWGPFTVDASGNLSGIITLPSDISVGTHWLRILAGPTPGPQTSVWAPFAVVPNDAGRDIQVTSSAHQGGSATFTGSGLLRHPVDYWPLVEGEFVGGQTIHARLDGTGPAVQIFASNGNLTGSIPVPAGTPLGEHTIVFYVGFWAQADGPQAVFVRNFTVTAAPPVTPPVTTPPTTPPAPTCPTRPRFNSVIYSNGVTSFYYRPQPGQRILGARRLGAKTLRARLATAQGRSTLPRLEYTTDKVVDAKKLPWFARKVGPRRVVTAIMSNADSNAYSGVRLAYQPKRGTYAKLILPNGNVQRLRSNCPNVTGYKTIYAQNIFVNRRSS